jgi:hypothetical protein
MNVTLSVPAPPAKKENQKTKFLGLIVDGRVRMLRSLARRRENTWVVEI